MKVLVTGGAGYIGSHTCVELLEAGHEVIVVDDLVNSQVTALENVEKITGKRPVFYETDAADKAAMQRIFAEHRPDAVIHFAGLKAVGESCRIPLRYYRNNLDSTLTLLEVMAEYGCTRLVFSSSATVYGPENPVPYAETMPAHLATNPYGWTKIMIEQMLRDYAAAAPGFTAVLLRYFNPIGGHASGLLGDDPNGIPNNLMPYIARVAAVVLLVDVTEREQREALRREFSANVSHELRTPLTSISGFAELMQAGLVPMEKVQEFSADIYRESRRLLELVNDIIKLSRLDEGADKLERQRVELHALAENVLANLESVAEKCHVTLSLTGGAAYVTGVPALLSEMLYNLCDNAVKYNVDGGSVCVDIAQSTAETVLTVSDTGIGIPYAHQSRVFERFYRVDKSHSKAVGGTGLGLSIVKHAAQYHNARLELKSAVGKGTEIRIHFPHAP